MLNNKNNNYYITTNFANLTNWHPHTSLNYELREFN
jgi:hypothetical protein